MSKNKKTTTARVTASFLWDLIILFIGAILGYIEFGAMGFVAGLVVSILLILLTLLALIPVVGIILYYFLGMSMINWILGLGGIASWGITFNFLFIVFGLFAVLYAVMGFLVLLVLLANI